MTEPKRGDRKPCPSCSGNVIRVSSMDVEGTGDNSAMFEIAAGLVWRCPDCKRQFPDNDLLDSK